MTVTDQSLTDLTDNNTTKTQLLEFSFNFLLDREPNTSNPLSHPAPLSIGSAQEDLVCECECRFTDGMDDDAFTKSLYWKNEKVLPRWKTTTQYPEGREYHCYLDLLLKVDEQD